MSLGRLIPLVSAVVLSGGVALAQPKGGAPAPAPAPAPPPADGAGSGSAVAPIEEAPPSDMEGTSEDPDAPRGGENETSVTTVAPPTTTSKSGYPIEESQRPITLPENMAEISLSPHFMASPYIGGDTLRARYGITRQVQLGIAYVIGGVYDDPATPGTSKKGFHVGKTAGLELTVLIKKWLGVKAGVPVYFDPLAVSFMAGAPMRFIFEKFTLGGLDDVLNIRITKFAPRFDYEAYNQAAAFALDSNTEQSRGFIRVGGYGIYQQSQKLALMGRVGIDFNLGSGGGSGAGTASASETQTYLKGGVQLTPKRFLDVGILAGFEDLSRAGSFGLTGILAVRI